MKKITIIGSGATETLLAINLIKHAGSELIEINVVDKKERLGRGVAYSTAKDFHLLNVPANKMGAFPDDIEHFYKWLTEKVTIFSQMILCRASFTANICASFLAKLSKIKGRMSPSISLTTKPLTFWLTTRRRR
jgi:uncharacterized NAD(P)/FAD-binding protein YdhS